MGHARRQCQCGVCGDRGYVRGPTDLSGFGGDPEICPRCEVGGGAWREMPEWGQAWSLVWPRLKQGMRRRFANLGNFGGRSRNELCLGGS